MNVPYQNVLCSPLSPPTISIFLRPTLLDAVLGNGHKGLSRKCVAFIVAHTYVLVESVVLPEGSVMCCGSAARCCYESVFFGAKHYRHMTRYSNFF